MVGNVSWGGGINYLAATPRGEGSKNSTAIVASYPALTFFFEKGSTSWVRISLYTQQGYARPSTSTAAIMAGSFFEYAFVCGSRSVYIVIKVVRVVPAGMHAFPESTA